jgi:predicted dehydrogenase
MSPALEIVVVGGGWAGCRHIEAFLGTNRVNVSLVEPNPATRGTVLSRYPLRRAFTSTDEALSHRWDAAVVAVPAHLHVAIGRSFTSRGIPVLLEKPVAVETAGVEEWIDDVHRDHTLVAVGFVLRHHPALVSARDHAHSGGIGDPVELVIRRGAHLPARRADYSASYYSRLEQGGGVVHDILSHAYNAAEWLLGPTEVIAADAAHLVLEGTTVPDTVHALARYGRVLASFSVNQHQRVPEFTLDVHGTLGSVRVDFVAGTWMTSRNADAPWEPHAAPVQSSGNFSRQAHEFLRALAGDTPPRCSLREGFATLEAVHQTLAHLHDASWHPTQRTSIPS